jgi:hypothetical protein
VRTWPNLRASVAVFSFEQTSAQRRVVKR